MNKADRAWTLAAWAVAAAALVVYGVFRVRFVGGCDSSSYWLEALRIRGHAPGLALDPTVPIRGPLAPLCLVERNGDVSSIFPPGFPLLLALGDVVGLPFFVPPLLGAASGVALYHAVAARQHRAMAFLTMVAWLASPMVVWGGTQLLSDFSAAAFSIFAVLAVRKQRFVGAGALFGFSLSIRPTQLLFAPALVLMLWTPTTTLTTQARQTPHRKAIASLALGTALAVAAALVFLRLSRGTIPLNYGVNLRSLDGAIWTTQLRFLLRHTFSLHLPVIALAVVGLAAHPRVVLPLLVWYLAYLGLYSLWHWQYDLWWWLRYLLPALPAVFLAAAEGADVLVQSAGAARRGARRALAALGVAVVAGYATWTFAFSPVKRHLVTTFDRHYPLAVETLSRIVPAGALVGSLNLSGPLRLYAHYQSFFWCHPDTVALIRWAADTGRPIYTVLDDGELRCNPDAAKLASALGYDVNVMGTLATGQTVRRLGPP